LGEILTKGGVIMPLKKRKKPEAKKRKAVKRKVAKRRPAKKKAVKRVKKAIRRPAAKKAVEGKQIGIVTHYFPHVMAAVVKVSAPVSVGDTLKIKGHTSDFTQKISSMQVDHVPVEQAKKGDEIGLLVKSRVRQHDAVYKV